MGAHQSAVLGHKLLPLLVLMPGGQSFLGAAQVRKQAFPVDIDLEHVIRRPGHQGLPHQLEIREVAQHQNHALKGIGFQRLDQADAVHLGHFQIRDHHVHRLLGKEAQGFLAVAGGAGDFKALLLPGDHLVKGRLDDGFVIHQQNPEHPHPLLARP